MTMKSTLATVAAATFLALVGSSTRADSVKDTIAAICSADQSDRQKPAGGAGIDWPEVRIRDSTRREAMSRELLGGRIRTSDDYYCAALVFQHGETADDIRMAFSLATLASAMNPAREESRYMSAAAWDRLMLKLNRPQWYGTQYVRLPSGGWALYATDESAVTDKERGALAVQPIADARKEAEALNRH